MSTMTLRLNDPDAEFEGKSISDFIRDAVFEKIEDQDDLQVLREAIASDDGRRFNHAEVINELGLK